MTMTLDQAAAIARAWSMVHAVHACCCSTGGSKTFWSGLPEGTTAENLLEAMLKSMGPGKLPMP